jgi:nucleoside-diphosphate-sugar epimerase
VSSAALCRQLGEALDRPARLFSLPSILIPSKLRRCLVADDAALRRELGWAPPFTLQEGLRATARWYLSR